MTGRGDSVPGSVRAPARDSARAWAVVAAAFTALFVVFGVALTSERASRPIVVPGAGKTPFGTEAPARKGKDMEALDVRVRSLAARIEVTLAYLGRGQRNAVWDKLRADSYEPSGSLRTALPGGLLNLLDDLERTKYEYISLRETGRYKRLLRSLPGYDHDRVDNIIVAQQQNRAQPPREPDRPGGSTVTVVGTLARRVTGEERRGIRRQRQGRLPKRGS